MNYTLEELLKQDPYDIIEDEIVEKLQEIENIDNFIETSLKTLSENELFTLFDAIIISNLDISGQWFKKLIIRLQQSKNNSIKHKIKNITEYYKDLIYKGEN